MYVSEAIFITRESFLAIVKAEAEDVLSDHTSPVIAEIKADEVALSAWYRLARMGSKPDGA